MGDRQCLADNPKCPGNLDVGRDPVDRDRRLREYYSTQNMVTTVAQPENKEDGRPPSEILYKFVSVQSQRNVDHLMQLSLPPSSGLRMLRRFDIGRTARPSSLSV